MLCRTLLFWIFACLANAQPQFEVASVKPADTAAGPGRAMVMARMLEMMPAGQIPMPDPGRVHIQGWPLRHVIAAAYRVKDDKVSGPSWMEDVHFDIDAKLPHEAKADDAHEMLQTLLAERFGLELHREQRELPGFALVVGSHGAKLEDAAPPAQPNPNAAELTPEERQRLQDERGKQMMAEMQKRMRDGTHMPGTSRNSWTSVTTAQLAEHLSTMAGGPVVDETGLTGKYKVTIETWRGTDDQPEQTVFQAVEKLGLKLVRRKNSVDLLTIDKVSKTPTEN